MSAKIKLGKQNSTELIKHISEVENGLKCDCVCVECSEKLIAINNKNNKREIHFRHEVETNCKGGVETSLHLLAKQIVLENSKIKIHEKDYFNYTKSEKETPLADYQPDVIIENLENKGKWLIEIAVTSFVQENKLEKIKRDNLNCLEIDLKDVDRKIEPDELTELIINEIKVRKVLNLKTEQLSEKDTKDHKENDNSLLFLFLSILAYFGLKNMFKRKKQ